MSRRLGLIDHTVDALRTRILSGEWPVGTRIPTEPVLVEMLGVGRNTVREAVHALVHSGLVERRQGSGTYVVGNSELAVTLSREVARTSQSDAMEVRRALQVEAARLAAARCTTDDIAVIQQAHEDREIAYASGDHEQKVAGDLALHMAVVRASGNALLVDLYENLIDAVRDSVVADPEGDAWYDALIAAIVARDPSAAGRETAYYLTALLD